MSFCGNCLYMSLKFGGGGGGASNCVVKLK